MGGGGTIAYIPAKYGMDAIDSGVAFADALPVEVPAKPTSTRPSKALKRS
ncbi:MAG: hypothetical protein ACLTMP_08620 [Eggerthella lenta]